MVFARRLGGLRLAGRPSWGDLRNETLGERPDKRKRDMSQPQSPEELRDASTSELVIAYAKLYEWWFELYRAAQGIRTILESREDE